MGPCRRPGICEGGRRSRRWRWSVCNGECFTGCVCISLCGRVGRRPGIVGHARRRGDELGNAEFLHDPALHGDQVSHFPALKAALRGKEAQQLQERRDEWAVEIHHDADLVASPAGYLACRAIVHVLAIAVVFRAHLARDG